MLTLNSLQIGEIDETQLIEIKESITSLSVDLTTTMVSELKFNVYDEYLNMFNANYFTIGRTVTYENEKYVIASASVKSSSKGYNITVKARSKATEDMRWAKGNKSFGSISPSTFAKNMAEKYGLKIFAEDSPVNGTIRQESNDNEYESIWMVLQRLARDLDFLCFEARGVLFFASMDFIVSNAPEIEVNCPPLLASDSDPFYTTNFSLTMNEDVKQPYYGTAALIANPASISIYPGVVVRFPALKQFSKVKFMVERVTMKLGRSEFVSLSVKASETIEEAQCVLKDFAIGSSGVCVERIQKAVLTTVDGKFGPVTERAVKAYQKFYGHPQTGVVSSNDGLSNVQVVGARPGVASTWELIINPPNPPGKYVKQPISGGSVSSSRTSSTSSTTDSAPVIVGYDEAGQPVYSPLDAPVIIGYDEAGQPIYKRVIRSSR